MSTVDELPRRDVLKGGLVLGAAATTAGLSFWSRLAMAQDEVLLPFADVPEGFYARYGDDIVFAHADLEVVRDSDDATMCRLSPAAHLSGEHRLIERRAEDGQQRVAEELLVDPPEGMLTDEEFLSRVNKRVKELMEAKK